MSQTPQTARDVAVSALRDRAGNVSAHMGRLLSRGGLGPAEKALAGELALGSLRRRATLQAVLQAFLEQPDKHLPAPLREILHVGLYQILFLDRVPDFAAVNEAVEQAIHRRHRRRSKLVNGVLRAVTRNVSPVVQGPPVHAADVIPVGPDAYRTVHRAVFPEPSDEPAGYLAAAFSLPLSLVERWLERFGSLEKVADIATHANVRAPLILRVNRLKAGVEQVLERLESDGIRAGAHANGCSVVPAGHLDVTELSVFRDGWVQPQDPTATAVALTAKPRPGMNVLDFCAAPGTKTTHLAELMDDRGKIVAVDVSREKLERVTSNCQRMGATIVTRRLAEDIGSLELRSFDLVLVDAPCSNTGVLARRAEARWRFDPQQLVALARDQQLLLAAAAQFVVPGGRVVYSTCSIELEECSRTAEQLIRRVPRLTLLREELTLPAGAGEPTQWHDGGYTAVFQAS